MYLKDGIDHINIYSDGATEIGRFLSNFSFSPILTEDGKFASIEGYWYWLGCNHPNKNYLRKLSGYEAKRKGREFNSPDWIDDEVFKDKIKKAIRIKINTYPKMLSLLKSSDLPLTHYYIFNGRKINVPKSNWIVEFIDQIRRSQF